MKTLGRLISFVYFCYICVWFVILILLAFPITLVLLLLPPSIRDLGMLRMLQVISYLWFWLCGIWPRTYNRSKIDFSNAYIITPNHQSYIDAGIIYICIPGLFKTVGKVEIGKTPIYGLIYKTVVITVDRQTTGARASSFRRMKQELDKGCSIAIFPEGTFPDEIQSELLPFHAGGFALAMQEQKPILPVLFLDAAQRMHPKKIMQFTPGLCRCVYLPPIVWPIFDKQQVEGMKQYVHKYMQACLDEARTHGVSHLWDYATQWLQQNPIPA
jgi:1-acyl-sn-glycerol-3-phosphate acyltransferase